MPQLKCSARGGPNNSRGGWALVSPSTPCRAVARKGGSTQNPLNFPYFKEQYPQGHIRVFGIYRPPPEHFQTLHLTATLWHETGHCQFCFDSVGWISRLRKFNAEKFCCGKPVSCHRSPKCLPSSVPSGEEFSVPLRFVRRHLRARFHARANAAKLLYREVEHLPAFYRQSRASPG